MLDLMLGALRRHGAPDAAYLDNGATYRGNVLRLACERLPITLIHAPPYDAPPRGKMGRVWGTLREGCLDHLGPMTSLHDVQARLLAFLDEHYHVTPHGGLFGKTPAAAWAGAVPRPAAAHQPATPLTPTRAAASARTARSTSTGRRCNSTRGSSPARSSRSRSTRPAARRPSSSTTAGATCSAPSTPSLRARPGAPARPPRPPPHRCPSTRPAPCSTVSQGGSPAIAPRRTDMSPPYLAHFALSEPPFSKLAVVEILLEALDEHASVVLVGEPGVGKTCVLRALRHRIPAAGFRLTYYHNATLGRRDFYRQLCHAVGIAPAATAGSLFYGITRHVEDRAAERIHPVFLLDESHLLHQDTLDHLHILLNYAWDSRALLSLILVGLPELRERLALRHNRSLYSRIHHRLEITALTPDDTAEYLRMRLARAGCKRELFASDAVVILHEATLA